MLDPGHPSRFAAQPNRWLWVYLTVAVLVHAAGAAVLQVWNPVVLKPILSDKSQPITPVDFVYVEPSLPGRSPQTVRPLEATRRAQSGAEAGQQANPELPVQAGQLQVGQLQTGQFPSQNDGLDRSRLAGTPDPQINRPKPSPSPALRSAPAQPPLQRNAAGLPVPFLSAELDLTASPPPPATSPPIPSVSPAAQVDGSASVVLEGQGLSPHVNADRAGLGTSIDAVQDLQWGSYVSGLNQALDQNWQRVSVAAIRRTRIQFRVDRQGHLIKLELLQSSGDPLADQAAMQAVRASAPFAPLPQDALEKVLIVNFTFTQGVSPAIP